MAYVSDLSPPVTYSFVEAIALQPLRPITTTHRNAKIRRRPERMIVCSWEGRVILGPLSVARVIVVISDTIPRSKSLLLSLS